MTRSRTQRLLAEGVSRRQYIEDLIGYCQLWDGNRREIKRRVAAAMRKFDEIIARLKS